MRRAAPIGIAPESWRRRGRRLQVASLWLAILARGVAHRLGQHSRLTLDLFKLFDRRASALGYYWAQRLADEPTAGRRQSVGLNAGASPPALMPRCWRKNPVHSSKKRKDIYQCTSNPFDPWKGARYFLVGRRHIGRIVGNVLMCGYRASRHCVQFHIAGRFRGSERYMMEA